MLSSASESVIAEAPAPDITVGYIWPVVLGGRAVVVLSIEVIVLGCIFSAFFSKRHKIIIKCAI